MNMILEKYTSELFFVFILNTQDKLFLHDGSDMHQCVPVFKMSASFLDNCLSFTVLNCACSFRCHCINFTFVIQSDIYSIFNSQLGINYELILPVRLEPTVYFDIVL